MSDQESSTGGPESAETKGHERLLLFVFFASGFLALVYEICWIRKASLVFGAATFALSCVLAVFFGGLALGSWWFGRVSHRCSRPLRLYAILEWVVAVSVALSPAMFALADRIYGAAYENLVDRFALLTLVRCALLAVVMAPPTIAMGGTFPLMCRWFVRSRERVSGTVGGLFALNTLGACLGAAMCGLYLVPEIGVSSSIYIGSIVSGLLGALVWKLSAKVEAAETEPVGRQAERDESGPAGEEVDRKLAVAVGAMFFLSGVVALGNEILWSRFLSLILLRSVYTYTIVLTVILLGLVMGAAGASRFFDASRRRAAWFGFLQMSVGLSVLFVLLAPPGFWLNWVDAEGLVRQGALVMLVLLIPACLSGAAFPLAIRMVVEDPRTAGRGVGRMTALNTVGGILGSVVFGFFLLPGVGMHATALISTGLSVAAGAFAILMLERTLCVARRVALAVGGLLLWLALAGGMKTKLPQDYLSEGGSLLDFREGVDAFVSVVEPGAGDRYLKIDRLWQGTSRKGHQVMAAHIPMMLHPAPRDIAVVGMGAGQTPGRFLMYDIDRLDCVDIESETVAMARKYFESSWMEDRRVRFVIDDGRNYLTHTKQSYDLISIEVGQTYRPGVASFYTREFYEAAAKRLKSGGILCQFLPVAFFSLEEIEMLTATFLAEFPQSVLWYNTAELLLIGQRSEPIRIHDSRAQLVATNAALARDMSFSYWGGVDYFLVHPSALLGGFLMGAEGLAKLADGADIYSDERPWLEYSSVAERNSEKAFVERTRPLLDPVKPLLGFKIGSHVIRASESVRDKNLRDMVAVALKEKIRHEVRQGDRQAALNLMREAANWNPDNIHLQMLLADELSETVRYEEAAAIYRRVIAAKPGYAEAHNNLGNTLANLNRLTEAIACFREALRRKPDLDSARADLQRALEERGRTGATLEELKETARLNPHNTFAMLDLAQALFDAGDYQGSIAEYRRLLSVDPESPTALNDLAWTLAAAPEGNGRNPKEAIAFAERAVLMTGRQNSITVGTLAAAHAAAGDSEKAVKYSEEAIGLAVREQQPEIERVLRERLNLYRAGKDIRR